MPAHPVTRIAKSPLHINIWLAVPKFRRCSIDRCNTVVILRPAIYLLVIAEPAANTIHDQETPTVSRMLSLKHQRQDTIIRQFVDRCGKSNILCVSIVRNKLTHYVAGPGCTSKATTKLVKPACSRYHFSRSHSTMFSASRAVLPAINITATQEPPKINTSSQNQLCR